MSNETKFEWTEDLAIQFAILLRNNKEKDHKEHKSWRDTLKEFKQSKDKGSERIEVSIGSCVRNNKDSYNTVFQTSIPITSELAHKVKSGIEFVLNNPEAILYDKSYVEGLRKQIDQLDTNPQEVPQWYTRQEIYNWLTSKNYSKEIATELAEYWFRDLQGAFKKGWEKASNTNPAEPYKYFSPEKTFTQSEVDTIRKETWKAARLGKPFENTFVFKDIEDYLQSISNKPEPATQTSSVTEAKTHLAVEDKPETIVNVSDNINEMCCSVYNQAIDHAIGLINSATVYPVAGIPGQYINKGNIINSLTNLKK